MPYYRKLCGEKCFLSPIQEEDAGLWAAWLNDLEVALPLGDEAYTPITLEAMHRDVSEAARGQGHIFTIVDLATGQAIGRCLLFAVNPVDRSAMLGIFIGEKTFWRKGCGSEATRLLLDYAFNLLNLHSVMLGVFEFNRRALRVYEEIGFHRIGMRREARLIAGKKYGVILMDLLEDEFRARWPSTLPVIR